MASKQLVQRSRNLFTRLARFFNQLMREQLMCGPVTVQQCYTLETLEEVAGLLNPGNQAFQKILNGCRCGIPERSKGNRPR